MPSKDKGELERLQRELQAVTAERDRLMAENLRLAKNSAVQDSIAPRSEPLCGVSNKSADATSQSVGSPVLNNDAPLSEKIRLFRSLFHGREDVYARLWQNRQSGKVGYSPVCKNEWNRSLCQKPNVRCGDCHNRELSPFTDLVIQDHLDGKVTIGIYPLLENDTCRFLAVDFDKCTWIEDSAAFLETCRMIGISAALERSRSGNGSHVWIFFKETVAASEARKLGCYLLTETMSRRHELSMDSYDRLFPNQDTVPKGGFGNLIALPLQKGSAEHGNSLFLDNNFKPYSDQWSFLVSLGCVGTSTLDDIVCKAVRAGQILGVRFGSSEEDDRPWMVKPSGRTPELPPVGPFPSKVKLVISNMIFVEKSGLSSSLLNKIKRLAAFQNPEFYRKQKMRLSTALTPRVICCAEEFPQHMGIPRGCLDELQNLLNSVGIKVEISDKRLHDAELQATFHGQLTSVQEAATSELLRYDEGILVAPSGSGKTVVGISIIASRKTNTLVLVHRSPLLEQWRNQLASFLEIDPAKVGQVGGGKDKRNGILDVAMLQSLIRKGEVQDVIAEYGQVIVDECHHLPAVTFERVMQQIKARYVLGLTATPYRRDGHQPIILMQCGPLRYEIRQKDNRSQTLQHNLVRRDTDFTLLTSEAEPSIQDIYTGLMSDEARNRLILDDILMSLDEGRSPILLTERREHLEFFAAHLAKHLKNVVILRGGMGIKQRRAVAEQLDAIPDGEKRVLLATGRYIGEGFDDARLDTLFLTLPVSWKGTLMQYAGRLHRIHTNKREVRIYDYVDRNVPVLMKMFQRRLRGYRAMGYETDESKSLKEIIPDVGEAPVLSLWESVISA